MTNISLPVTINQDNFNFYFKTSIKECSMDDAYIKQIYENIYYLNGNKETKYYKYIEKYFINELLKKTKCYVLLLLHLLNKDFVRKNFLDIYNKKNDKTINKITNKALISDENSNIFDKYLYFLQGQFEAANDIFDGIYELVKNVFEHSEKHEGTISIKTTTEKLLKDTSENKTNAHLWKNYFAFVNNKLEGKTPEYLEISITDVGTIGIIETSLQNIKKEWRGIKEDIRNHDIEKIEKGIKDCDGNKTKEAELLFNMYFNQKKDN